MSNLGFRPIYKFDAANLKVLNDTLRVLWGKLTGRVEMRDLSARAQKVIDSKAEQETVNELTGEVTKQSTLITQTAEKIELKADKVIVDDLGKTVESHSTLISQTAEKIELKADKSVVDDLGKTVESHSTQITQTAEKIEQKADKSVVDDLGRTVESHSTAITQTAEKIEQKADKTVVDELGKTVESNRAEFELTAQNISQRVTDEVKGLQAQIDVNAEMVTIAAGRTVGGTNLVSLADGSVYVRGGNGSIDRTWSKESHCQSGVGILMYPPASGNYNCLYFDCGLNVAPGEYTLSFYCWTDFDGAQPVIRCNLNGEGHDHYFGDVSVPAWTPTRMTVTFSVDYEAGVVLRLLTWSVFTGNILITDVKLETGNTATAWSPYPGDPAGELDTGTGGGVQVTITKDRFNVNVPGADGDFELNETGGVLPVLRSKYVESPNLAYAYDGPATITVNPAASSDEIAAGGVYKSLPEALAALNNRQLAYDVTINVMGDSYGFEELYGVHGSRNGLVINGNGKTLIGRFRAVNCSTNIAINGLTFAYDSAYGKDYAVNFDNCSHVDLKNCVITGNKLAARGAWFAWGTRAYLEACEFYDVTDSAIRAGDNVDLLVMNAKGSADYYLWANGATIKWGGTRPAGLYYEDVPSICTDLTNLSVDYGSAAPEITMPVTAEYPMLYADSYAGGYENSWNYQSHDDIMQGYTEHAGRIYGCIWFDNAAIRAAVAGKTVKQATIRLTAQRYVGRGVAVEVHLYGTTTEYAGRNGPPVLVNYDSGGYGVIGTATPGETTTISIPIDAAADLARGAINGLVLYSDDETLYGNRNYSRNYMRFDGSTSGDASTRPVLTVVYE